MYPFISLALARSVLISADWWQWFKEMGRNVAPCYIAWSLFLTRKRPYELQTAISSLKFGFVNSASESSSAVAFSTRLLPFLPCALASADVFGPFHDCAFCERAAPDAPETIDDQRRCTGCRYRTIYSGSRGSASLPRRRSGSVLSLLSV